MRRFKGIIILLVILAVSSGCVYFNTFYYARKSFNDAESKRKEAVKKGQGKNFGSFYAKAVEKSQKVLDKYPNSSWYDDALYVNGVSNYYMEDYSKAEKRFRELIANYPQSKYIKEARLFLAQSKLKLNEEADAMVLFEKLFEEGKDKDIKSSAALALGQYYFENKNYDNANKYFKAMVDSLGNEADKRVAQMYIADGEMAQFMYRRALEDYLKVLKLNPDLKEKYRATYKAGECCLYLHEIDDGMGYLNKLAADRLYYDSLPALKLMIAFGHELNGDLTLAEEEYKSAAQLAPRYEAGAMANYNLGLIYQFDYEDYEKAKEYYDKAKSFGPSLSIYQDALQRSSDIGKLEQYSQNKSLDSLASQADIDNAAKTQYMLAELYLTQLGKPDSALQEFRFVANKFKDSYLAPKSKIAIALMMRDNYDDTLAFDTTLRSVLRDYPKSDFLPEAIGLLGLAGTMADTGYAAVYYKKAEHFVLDTLVLDSARHYYRMVADSFPNSELNNKAKYALLWLTENYAAPGDSTLYYAYADFADSFSTTDYGKEAGKKLVVKPKIVRESGKNPTDTGGVIRAATADSSDTVQQATLSPEQKYYIDPDGKPITLMDKSPIRIDREFKYPTAAYTLAFEGFFYFQIKINPFGDLDDVKLMNPSPSEELNDEATETVRTMHFDTRYILPEFTNSWFVYKYYIQLPGKLK